jgi:hypothetical protein
MGKGDVEALRAQPSLRRYLSQRAAQLDAERARTEKAISAFAALADPLDALAAEGARPWWRRLTG